jgi:curved DNA-binding protein CbpA
MILTLPLFVFWTYMNHYQILGVVTAATQSDIKRAYRDLVKIHHPDINPQADSHELMQKINEAYEVLSEAQSRNLYDLILSGYSIPLERREETEAEKYRREYKRKRAHDERVNFENLIKLKVSFYKVERYASYLFFAIGILFTLDYFIFPFQSDYEILSMESNRYQTQVRVQEGEKWLADWSLLDEYREAGAEQVTVYYSAVFNIPARIRLKDSSFIYRVFGTLHSFRNVITLIILVFSGIVIKHKEYSDFRLTCGLVPVLLVIFQLLLVQSGRY